jgi:eukaryotic-like serine/threonine-protein kinase
VGERCGQNRVVQIIQIYEDTEVYEVTDGENRYALKIARVTAGTNAFSALAREADILHHLDGSVSPLLHEYGKFEDRPYLVTAWCAGIDIGLFADRCRATVDPSAELTLRQACTALLETYSRLHNRSVLHGDVHPRNVVIDDQGKITLLDFGLARIGSGISAAGTSRRGVSFYFEPEYALKRYRDGAEIKASLAGEQYSIAALLFRLLTGEHYLDFQLDDTQLRQIAEDAPRSFAECGAAPWPAGEAVLRRALAKQPGARFDSVGTFACHLRAACAASEGAPAPVRSMLHARALLEDVSTSFDAVFPDSTLAPPTCSVYYGWAGIAYAAYRFACLRENSGLLELADVFAERAMRHCAESLAFSSPELLSTSGVPEPTSLFHGLGGVICVRALVSLAQCDAVSAKKAVHQFGEIARRPHLNRDATLGTASLLLGASAVLDALGTEAREERHYIVGVGDGLQVELEKLLSAPQPIGESEAIAWLGIAHGWAGILYAILRWHQATLRQPPLLLRDRLDELAELAEESGRGARWPRQPGRRMGPSKPAAGWCHGTGGHVHLWTLAHGLLKNGRYAETAERAAWHTWESTGNCGGGLCCGLGGQAYALLTFGKHTGDNRWRDRAQVFTELAANQPGLRPYSLFHGEIGLALLTADLTQESNGVMPLFTSEI